MYLAKKIFNKLNLRRQIEGMNLIAPNVKRGSNTVITGSRISGDITIGDNCKITRCEIQGRVTIGNFTSLSGPNIDIYSLLNRVTIGNFCSIARNVSFQEYNHNYQNFTTYFVGFNLEGKESLKEDVISKGAIEVGNDVWIGTHCVILSGSTIGTGAIIAANSVVSGNIPPYAIAAGSPARVIKYRFDEETISRLLKTEWWNWDKETIVQKLPFLTAITQKTINDN